MFRGVQKGCIGNKRVNLHFMVMAKKLTERFIVYLKGIEKKNMILQKLKLE